MIALIHYIDWHTPGLAVEFPYTAGITVAAETNVLVRHH
jgi:hypothetical protein